MQESSPTIMTTREARILAENLASHAAGEYTIATRVAIFERDASTAARLMLRQVHPFDPFQLPPES
jgi:hypothetical protein